ncbi:MAG: hypothetical protein WKF58_11305 [Ilumatobacteraceae bacterium]
MSFVEEGSTTELAPTSRGQTATPGRQRRLHRRTPNRPARGNRRRERAADDGSRRGPWPDDLMMVTDELARRARPRLVRARAASGAP